MSPRQTVKFLCLVSLVSLDVGVNLTLALIRHTFSSGKSRPRWSLRQALRIRMTKSLLRWISTTRIFEPLSLEPMSEGDRFCLIPPAARSFYIGPMQDVDIRPETIGATWTPESPPCSVPMESKEMRVVLHFHGGAYILGNGRDGDTGW